MQSHSFHGDFMSLNQSQQEVTQEQAIEQSFRSSLDDTISVLEGLAPLCEDIPEMVKMLELAINNDAQLRLIMSHLAPKRMRK